MKSSLSNQDKLGLITSLATMLTAGIPILEAVESLLEDAKGEQRKILKTLKSDLNQGQGIGDSLAKFPDSFNVVSVSLIKASEQSGTLEATLKDLSSNIKEEIEFKDKVRAALIYPLLILIVFTGVLVMILTFVIPRIGRVFSQLRIDLPLPTRILVALSDFLINYTPFILAGIVILVFGLIWLYHKKKSSLLNLIFSLPLVSKLITLIDLTQFSRTMSLLLHSGITETDALELAEKVVIQSKMSRVIKLGKERVSSGKTLSEELSEHKKLIPPIFVRMVEAGEKSGTLEKSMQESSEYFNYAVSNSLKSLTALLEPVMLVVIGIMVGGVMMSIIAPIYGLIGKISP